MPSIIIPAHNEEAIIGVALTTLLANLDTRAMDVVVVCNGCTDGTARAARSVPGPVRVFEIEEASKPAALNFGDDAATSYPRIYLDADVEIDGASIERLLRFLEQPGAIAAEAVPRIETRSSTLPVRAFYAVWIALHSRGPGDIGSGLYAMSREGRKRFGPFPDVIADDAFVRAHFDAGELARLPGVTSVVYAPARVADLLEIKTRSRLGVLQLQQRYPNLWSQKRTRTEPLLKKAAAIPLRLWPAIPIYAALQIEAKRRARRLALNMDEYQWQRDESSRHRRLQD